MNDGIATAAVQSDTCVVHLFGHARLEIDGLDLALRGPIKRGLVAMLALDLGRSVHADRLVDGLWDENAGGDILQSLRVHISQLRTFLDERVSGARQYIEGRYPLYRLSQHVTTDFTRASALRDRALDRLAHDPEAALRDLEAAQRLVAEDPLAEVLHLPFARFAVDPLRAFQHQLADDYAEVATTVWGSREPIGSTPDCDRSTSIAERRWLLFTRLSDAPPGMLDEGESTAVARGRGGERPDVSASRRVAGKPLPREIAFRAPAVFVGRRRERASLLDLQAAVGCDGRSRIVEIVGPGGVGKTALAATVASDLAASGTSVRYASWSGSTLAAHAPFVEAGLVQAPASDQPHSNPPLGQDALAAEIIDHLRTLEDNPVALIFDDVDRLPPRYQSVIERVLEQSDVPALVVFLHRPGPRDRELEAMLPPDTHRIRLRPFSGDELADLEEALGGKSAPDAGRDLPWVAGLLLAPPGDEKTDRIREAVDQIGTGDRELIERLALAPAGLMLRTLQHGSAFAPVETWTACEGWSPAAS